MADNDKALIASSEFDPSAFIKGIDAMTASLEKLSAQEDAIKQDLSNINTALKSNRTELKATEDQIKNLDKSSKTYADDLKKLTDQQAILKTQQKDLQNTMKTNREELVKVNTAANDYKAAITGIAAVSRQVAQENKGRTLFDVASLNQQVAEVVEIGQRLRGVFNGKIDDTELDQLEKNLAEAGDEMQQLAQIVAFTKEKLDTLDPNSQEFADLSKVIQTGEEVLDAYNKTLDDTGKKSVSLRGQLQALRTQLVQLEDQGKENTQEFLDLQIQAGKLQDAIGDAQQRIKVLSSDTKNLDFGIGAIRGVASAFGVAEGAAALFGVKNEDVMQSIQRLNAIMLILNGLQEIQNLLQKQSVVAIVGQEIALKGAAIAQRIYAVTVGTATGAMKAFRLALLATGIGAFIILIGALTNAFGLFSDETETATTSTDDLTEAIKKQDQALEDLNNTLDFNSKIRIENLKQSGAKESAIFQEGLNNRKAQLKNFQDALVEAQFRQTLNDDENRNRAAKTQGDISKKEREQRNANTKLLADDVAAKKKQVENAERDITLFQEQEETKRFEAQRNRNKAGADLYRAYLERLRNLQRQLRDKTLEATPEDAANIRQQFANSLGDLSDDIDREVKSGKLSKQKGAVLKNLVTQINKVDLDKALLEFNKRVQESQTQFDRQLTDLQLKNATDRANLIRDELVREAAIIQADYQNQANALAVERDELIEGIRQTQADGLISPEAAQANIDRVGVIYDGLLLTLAEKTTRAQEEISARVFQLAQENLQRIFSVVQLEVSEAATAEIVAVSERFVQGKITYEKYQKELTRISREESFRRVITAIRENEALLKGVEARLALEKDPQRAQDLKDQVIQLRKTISDLKRQEAEGIADDEQAADKAIDEKIGRIATYAQAIGGIVNQVVQFWAAANQAESEALDRSIALQERRVDAAVRIAERGNSEYLRLEEDRLNELQVKQENAARRQLAINAVLQTSQALTAFVTALAQGIATGGPLGGIAVAAAVIGLLASGYAIISSLQANNRQTLFRGTKNVKRENGEPSGVDTVPAMLTEGEAVIPKDTNKQYSAAVGAIYDKSIPADDMNAFVNSYRVNRRVLPRLDTDRMGEVASVVVNTDGRLLEAAEVQNRQLAENNELLRTVAKTLAGLGIEATIDRNGLAISLMKATQQFTIDKKA